MSEPTVSEQPITEEERLVSGLRRELEIYEGLAALVREQAEIIRRSDGTALARLAEAKQEKLREVDGVEAELRPLKAAWAGRKASAPPEVAREVETALDRLETVLGDLVRMEEESVAILRSQREDTSAAIRAIEAGRRLHDAYQAGTDTPRLIDRKE